VSSSDIIAIIQTLLAIGAFIFTYGEFKKWRTELLGTKKIELALRLGKAAIEVREAFKYASSFIGSIRDSRTAEYKPDSTPAEKLKQDQEYGFNQQLERIHSRLEQLYDIRWEILVLFGENESIDEQVKIYNAKFHELQRAMFLVFQNEGTTRELDMIHSGFTIAYDEFGKEIEITTEKLLKLAHKYTK
jgi:hypothetical protein